MHTLTTFGLDGVGSHDDQATKCLTGKGCVRVTTCDTRLSRLEVHKQIEITVAVHVFNVSNLMENGSAIRRARCEPAERGCWSGESGKTSWRCIYSTHDCEYA